MLLFQYLCHWPRPLLLDYARYIDYARYRVDWVLTMLEEEDSQTEELYWLIVQVQEILARLDEDVYYNSSPLQRHFSGFKERPSFHIPEEQLELFIDFNFTVQQIAKMLGVSTKTIHRRLKGFGLSMRQMYANLTDIELDNLVSTIIRDFPNSGYKAMCGHLLAQGYRIQEN